MRANIRAVRLLCSRIDSKILRRKLYYSGLGQRLTHRLKAETGSDPISRNSKPSVKYVWNFDAGLSARDGACFPVLRHQSHRRACTALSAGQLTFAFSGVRSTSLSESAISL